MLEYAKKHETKLRELFLEIVFDKKYMYYNNSVYYNEHKINESTWNNHDFVSLDKDGNVIGYIVYEIDRSTGGVLGFAIINFSENKTFGKDVHQAIDDIFCKFQFEKLEYCVVVGNPIEQTYDRLTKKYGGRVVGTQIKHRKLIDGNIYDLKIYELFKEDYMRNRPNYFIKKEIESEKINEL